MLCVTAFQVCYCIGQTQRHHSEQCSRLLFSSILQQYNRQWDHITELKSRKKTKIFTCYLYMYTQFIVFLYRRSTCVVNLFVGLETISKKAVSKWKLTFRILRIIMHSHVIGWVVVFCTAGSRLIRTKPSTGGSRVIRIWTIRIPASFEVPCKLVSNLTMLICLST